MSFWRRSALRGWMCSTLYAAVAAMMAILDGPLWIQFWLAALFAALAAVNTWHCWRAPESTDATKQER